MAETTKPIPLVSNEDADSQLEIIANHLQSFIDTYELDMRGDKDLKNGNRGVIGEIREIKDYIKKYPTISFQFSKNPIKVLSIILGGFIILDTLSTFGILRWAMNFLGIHLP